MKKNGEFVGVDEKFIPENEKYVDGPSQKDQEKMLKRHNKIMILFICIPFIFAIGTQFVVIFNKASKHMDSTTTKMNAIANMKGHKFSFSHLSGAKWGSELRRYLDDIITNNQLDAYAPITVVYNEKSAITPEEVLAIKNEIADTNSEDYEVFVEYADSYGNVISTVTIKDI